MKITNRQLKQIIKEELKNLILESNSPDERTDFFIQYFIETISSLVHAQPKDFDNPKSGFFESHRSTFQALVDEGVLNNVRMSWSRHMPDRVNYVINFSNPEQNKELHTKIHLAFIKFINTADNKRYEAILPTVEGRDCIIVYEYSWEGKLTIYISRKAK